MLDSNNIQGISDSLNFNTNVNSMTCVYVIETFNM